VTTKTHIPERAVFHDMRGADLPPTWIQGSGAGINGEMVIDVILESFAVRELSDLMDMASDEWEAKGGTVEILEDILNER